MKKVWMLSLRLRLLKMEFDFMFHATPPIPSKPKKIIYLIASTFLGLLLSFIAHAGIEMVYLSWALKAYDTAGYPVTFYGGCALPPAFQAFIWVLGIVGGFFLGKFWWQKVYIEQIWWRNKAR